MSLTKDLYFPSLALGIYGVDTRFLTKSLREHGSMLGRLGSVPMEDPNTRNLVAEVARKQKEVYGEGKVHVLAVDMGMKNNIIRWGTVPYTCHVNLSMY